MSKFVLVDKAPHDLKDKELVITEPDFINEIKLAKNQPRPMGNGKFITSLAHLRAIGGVIGELYDPEGYNPYSTIPFSHFVGIEYSNEQELSQVVLKMFNKFHPQIIAKYIDKKLKERPADTEVIYFVGSRANTEAFLSNGINELDGSGNTATEKKVVATDA